MPRPLPRIALAAALLCAAVAGVWWLMQRTRVGQDDDERVRAARSHVEKDLRALCRAAELPYPPDAIYLRNFKSEAQLEIWARKRHQPFRLLTTLPVLYVPGHPGPKRKEGDRQVPEGFYAIDLFNPQSDYHLSMRINYPNDSDRILSDKEAPGSDIYIHGSDGSIGCLPVGDANVEKLFVLALDTRKAGQQNIPVHSFPTRMSGESWEALLKQTAVADPKLADFWKSLKVGYDYFEQNRQVPKMAVGADGSYTLEGR